MQQENLKKSENLSDLGSTLQQKLEQNPASRTDHMEYQAGMEQIESEVMTKVISQMTSYDPAAYTKQDVVSALNKRGCSIQDLKALLSPAAESYLEELANKAQVKTRKQFGNNVYLFTPLYLANYCENYCVYCGFNLFNKIKRQCLNFEQIETEMKIISDTGIEEILLLTGESYHRSSIDYIGKACKIARKYFKMIGLEIYPVNIDDYHYLNQCGADYVTVFQETYDSDIYETLHLFGHKRVWPYRFESQERALRAGMRGVGFGTLFGLGDFRKDALATALHAYYLQRKYPAAEISLSVPRLRPIINNQKIKFKNVSEAQLCQIVMAYRIFLPFAGITVSTRESAEFRNGIVKIGATKISAGVSTGIGDHQEKYAEEDQENFSNCETGDEQFAIEDTRSLQQVYDDLKAAGLQPVLNDYLYV
ncbi:MAG: 2-iminoacetate synthase ThiH [Bacillota bacterium]|nr:2-iminoacetate synthase ThiH [Bacillota bacterium]